MSGDWNEKKARYEQAVREIRIPADIDEGRVKNLVAMIDDVYTSAAFDYAHHKALYENQKDMERATTKALQSSLRREITPRPSDRLAESMAYEEAINMGIYDRLSEYREKFLFMQAVIDSLDAKRNMLITDSSALKIEASLVPR